MKLTNEIKPNHSFVILITALTPLYLDSIITALVKLGYNVKSPLEDNKLITTGVENSPACIIGLEVFANEKSTSSDIYKDVSDILYNLKVFQYSVVITALVDCCWSGPNFSLPENNISPPSLKPYLN